MKKKLLFLITILLLPIMVNAKEYCTIVNGNGKDIGSEIACGTEHFYVIDSNDTEVKMLSKYNLDYGEIVYVEEMDLNNLINNNNYTTCRKIAEDKYNELIENGIKIKENYYTSVENRILCNIQFYLSDEVEVWQNKIAIGAHGSKSGEPEFPEYGNVQLTYTDAPFNPTNTIYGSNSFKDGEISKYMYNYACYNGYEENGKYISPLYDSLNKYKNNLNNIVGVSLKDIDIITVKEISDIVKKINNKELPLNEWGNSDWEYVDDYKEGHYLVGSIKDYLPDGYEWLYSTTYWTRTYYPNVDFGDYTSSHVEQMYTYFVDTLGNLCNSQECFISVGAGIRPVVTMSKEYIRYNIKTKTDGNGIIEVIDSAAGGETISFRVSAKKGLKLMGLTITTDSGEKVQFNEEDLTTNADGTISISTNKFTMPYENVLIQARWTSTISNPETRAQYLLVGAISLTVIGGAIYTLKKRTKDE